MRVRTNNQIDPAAVHTPRGFQRLKRGEKLRDGDMYLHTIELRWLSVDGWFGINNFTNCIRPVPDPKPVLLPVPDTKTVLLLAEHISYNDFQ